jgi:predicted transposase/invertase (TIGR01784 family)
MAHFINPFTDFGFKKIFGEEISKDLLISFLNELLKGEKEIKDITFLNNEKLPEFADSRSVIYDIFCETNTGEQIIVEMQYKRQANFKERSLYYVAKAIAAQGTTGPGWQFDVKTVYGVFFMNFTFDKAQRGFTYHDEPTSNDTHPSPNKKGKLRTDVILADRDTGEQFNGKLRQIFLELPYFTKNENECVSNFERWIYVLKNMENLERMPFKAQGAVFKRLEEIGNLLTLDSDQRRQYDTSLDNFRDNAATMAYAESVAREEGMEKGREEGREKGREEGREEGIQKGIEKGIEKGMEKGQTKATYKIAKSLKLLNTNAEIISSVTGLSIEDINNIQ